MTETQQPVTPAESAVPSAPAPHRRRWPWFALCAGIVTVTTAVIFASVAMSRPTPTCACAVPPDTSHIIPTAKMYVTAVANGHGVDPKALLTDDAKAQKLPVERSVKFRKLLDPRTVWTLTTSNSTTNPESRRWLVLGVAPDGTWDTLVVHTNAERGKNRVDPFGVVEGSAPTITRDGGAPVFSETGRPVNSGITLIEPGNDVRKLDVLTNGRVSTWTGDLLPTGRYLAVQYTSDLPRETAPFIVGATWLTVS